ncbi:S1/P1 Nuclease [Erythrobacter sp. QSSC1-22B]|uniref:S1/P1 nuclease n=1 Tax=Erythrobacter sp. QSSC1-22B TaxID=1860125 RepID=UPI0008049C93|nr:S1/P1 nuclease [Erythrobacter sp. QSSC1-22B]OBX18811.1 S1/P1 Nuclease [Erythrobacter sp. QSSC1-22B]
MPYRTALVAAAVAICLPCPAAAWGQLGHRVIGEIADERISGRTRAEIELILGKEDLAEASTWSDEQRSNPAEFWQREAGAYHYVTVPEDQTYNEVGPPEEGDALSALERFAATVRDRNASREDKALALKFIVHIVGDVHQPLHVGHGEDRGGNDVRLRWFGEETNLHRVWDSQMIEGKSLSYTEYAAWLDRQIEPAQTISWWDANPQAWIGESAQIRDTIYPTTDGELPNLGYDYQFQHLGTAELRLKQGGVRLAAYLDWMFQTGL